MRPAGRSCHTLKPVRMRPALTCVLAAVLLLAGVGTACGGGDDSSSEGIAASPAPAKPEDFPKPEGRSLSELLAVVGSEGPVLATSVSDLQPGTNRFGFALFDRAKAQIAEAPVVVYIAPVGGGPARGPFPADYRALAGR